MIEPGMKLDQIKPNSWNPNEMTDDQFSELVAEVQHLGKVPKPIVLRKNGKGFEIVDGEHTYRALLELEYSELQPSWFEVEDYDDFEAMRQTYKRNQHGTHDPVRQGLLFERMMAEGKLSRRALAKDIELSEGTIRNSLEYSQAFKVRNDYALSELTVKQVRTLNKLPERFGGMWFQAGCKLRDLLFDHTDAQINRGGGAEKIIAREKDYYDYDPADKFIEMAEVGLDELIDREWSGFRHVSTKLSEMYRLARRFSGGNVQPFWPYLVPFQKEAWPVRTPRLMQSALSRLIYLDDDRKVQFVVEPDEFMEMVEASNNAGELQQYLDLKRYKLVPDDSWQARKKMQLEMAYLRIQKLEPKQYVIDAALHFAGEQNLHLLERLEEILRYQTDGNLHFETAKETVIGKVLERGRVWWKDEREMWEAIRRYAEVSITKERQDRMSDEQLAKDITVGIAGGPDEEALLKQFPRAALEKIQYGVRLHIERDAHFKELEAILSAMP